MIRAISNDGTRRIVGDARGSRRARELKSDQLFQLLFPVRSSCRSRWNVVDPAAEESSGEDQLGRRGLKATRARAMRAGGDELTN